MPTVREATRMLSVALSLSALLVIAPSWDSAGSQGVATAHKREQDEALAQKIVARDGAAIEDAGKSGNKIFIPYLKKALKRRGRKGPDPKLSGAMRLALARLGDTQQLQQFWCNALSEDPSTGLHTPLVFGQIGGWFSIQALQVFLTPEGETHWKKAYSKLRGKYENDVIQMPPIFDALETLPKIVPSPPVGPLSAESQSTPQDLIKIWQAWLPAHKEELSKLEPTGEGVDFSDKACKNGKPRKKH